MAGAQVIDVELDGLDGTASPVVGDTFPAVDALGLYGAPGAPLFLSPAAIGLWSDSGIPGANKGSIDLTTNAFALNWGARSTLDIFDATGAMVGHGEILEVLPETGTFDPNTGQGTSATSGPEHGIFIIKDLGGNVLAIGDKIDQNQNNFAMAPDGGGGFDGIFLAGSGPELSIVLPSQLGGGEFMAELTGNFHLIPAPGTALMIAGACITMPRRRRC
ncbi:MAG: hypothetical protein IT435_03590 [Phycisphaerales bacterium]|nr:hypothetical protein [Phycisphaerales bacterium]